MKLRRGEWFVVIFTLLYIVAFGIYYVVSRNYEFMWYVAIMIFFFALIALTLRKSNFDYVILWGLSIWGLLHMAGGNIPVGDGVLYSWRIIPLYATENFFVLKYDQLVHFFGFGVTALVAYHLLKPYLNKNPNYKVLYPGLVLIAMGLGALNEILEFIGVLLFPKTNVGDYFNNVWDLTFNTLGAIVAVIILHFRRKYSNAY